MKKTSLSYIFIILLISAAGLLSWSVYFKAYRADDDVNIHHFPKVIGPWSSTDLPISQDEKELLETDNVFVRRYTNHLNEEVFLFIVYSQNNRKVSHPPEICYRGGGATILDNVPDTIDVTKLGLEVDVRRLKVERGDISQVFVYWFKVGDTFTSNYWKQQGLIALKSFFGKPSSSALIRVSSTITNGGEAKASLLIKEFGRLIFPDIQEFLP